MTTYTIDVTAYKEDFLAARIAIQFRKYGLDIHAFTMSDPNTYGVVNMTIRATALNDNMAVAMKKLESLVPIEHVSYSTE